MRVIRNRPDRNGGRGLPGRSAVTVGNFDGVHLGHQALIERCRELSGASDTVAVVTFEPLPHAFFNPPEAPARLSTVRRKLQLLQSHGVDLTWVLRFDRPAREVFETIMSQGLEHHISLTYGDYVPALLALAEMLGLPVLHI